MTTLNAIAAICLMLATTGPVAAATVFTERSLFDSAVGASTTETFEDEIGTATTITFASGTTATKSSAGIPPTLNRVKFGHYTGFVQKGGFRDITFDFGSEVIAFGANFESGLSNSSLMVMGMFDGVAQTFSIADAIGSSGFFGLKSDTGFNRISFRTNAGASFIPGAAPFGGETFEVDNLSLAGTDVAPIPIPASFGLMALAMTALGAIGRRRA